MSDSDYGTSGGFELTGEQLQALAEEAERGHDPERLRTRARRGRPAMGNEAATVFHVRLPPHLREALEQAADAVGATPSDIVRQALTQYLLRIGRGSREGA